MKSSVHRIGTLTGRNIKEILRDPISIIFLMAVPLFMEILFYSAFHKMTAQFEMCYLAPGIVIFSQSFLTLFSGLLISVDRGTSFLTRLYVSKAKAHEFILSYAFALVPLAAVQSVLFMTVGGLLDFSFWSVGIVYGILLSLVTSLFFIAVGIMLGSVCGEKSIGGVASIIITGQSVLSGMWFPVEGLSDGFQTFMKVLPFKNATMLVQNAINGVGDLFTDFFLPLIIVAAYMLAAIVGAVVLFRRQMKSL